MEYRFDRFLRLGTSTLASASPGSPAWLQKFNHRAAIDAAKVQLKTLGATLVKQKLSRLSPTIVHENEEAPQTSLATRIYDLKQFIEDAYAADSLLRVNCDNDRRLLLDAGSKPPVPCSGFMEKPARQT